MQLLGFILPRVKSMHCGTTVVGTVSHTTVPSMGIQNHDGARLPRDQNFIRMHSFGIRENIAR